MVEEYMRQIKSLLKKYKNKTITEDESLFLEYLMVDQLERIVLEKELSKEEQELLVAWKQEREFIKETENLFAFNPHEVEEEAYSSWEAFAQKQAIRPRTSNKPSTVQYLSISASVAAVIALLFLITPNINRNNAYNTNQTTNLAQNTIARQFTTDKKIKRVTLADGSVVHLNMASTLSLHKGKFNKDTREVWLDEGEAFFEITKDPKRPFIVHTADGLSTQVLGTSFNIKAYSELGEQVISVKTGRVQVSKEGGNKAVLLPNNKASFNANEGTLTTGITDGNLAAEWRTGNIVFQAAKIKEVAFRLKQYHNVEVTVSNNAIHPHTQLDISFSPNTPLQQIVYEIAKIYNVRYRITDNQVKFYR